uniref:Nudix hydrolase 18 n=1 Tax=Sphenodon punctatus TaxID=8508 RepID=A0A8D0H6G1_SPHPU
MGHGTCRRAGWSPTRPLWRPCRGGALKTLQDADAESLQALWCDLESPPHPLRARDILPLIDLAVQYQASPSHPPTLPVELPCTFICQRLLVAFSSGTGDVWILLSSTGSLHLPVTSSGTSPSELNSSLQVAVHRLLEQCLPLPQMAIQTRGLLGLQHLGKGAGQSDGVCFNVLVTVQHSGQGDQEFPPEMQGNTVTWWKVEDETLKSRILERLNVASVVPVYS